MRLGALTFFSGLVKLAAVRSTFVHIEFRPVRWPIIHAICATKVIDFMILGGHTVIRSSFVAERPWRPLSLNKYGAENPMGAAEI